MESASFMSFVSQAKNRLGHELRKGQIDVVERFTNSTTVTAQLPTGLGKTLTAAASYALLRKRNVANRVLYIVPRGGQARQAAEELPRDIGTILDQPCRSFIIGDTPVPAIKAHRSGASEIFITTIQALVSGGSALDAARDMVATGKWFVVVDEYHHYGDANKPWTEKVKSLPHQALLAMSATPHRQDESLPFGKPDVAIRYRDARLLGYVKELDLHAYDYRVDAMVNNVDVQTFTTSEIYKMVGSESPEIIDREMAVRELRWSPRYISPLLSHPIARMMSYPFKAQMLVQAISCSHAKNVCDQVKALVASDVRVDWVGTGPRGRSDADNERILHEFCPPKNPVTGIREWTLDILVNVGMAGEGLDCVDVCEVVFTNAPNLNNETLQAIGRLSRIPKGGYGMKGVVSVGIESEMAAYIGEAVETCFDEEPEIPKHRDSNGEERNGGDYPLPPDVIIKNAELIDIRKDPHYEPLVKQAMDHPSTAALAQSEIERMVEEALRAGLKRRDSVFNESSEIMRQKRRVENGCRLKAFQVQGMLKKRPGRLQTTEYQDIIKRIKTRKNRDLRSNPEEAPLAELALHMQWLERLELELKNGLPSWLS